MNKFWRIAKKTAVISFIGINVFIALTELVLWLADEPPHAEPHREMFILFTVVARWVYLESRSEVFR